jgi:hypothetical protein
MNTKKIVLKLSKDDETVGYLYLPKHPKTAIFGLVKKTISINELIKDYKGIPLYFDFDAECELIGIEISG